MALTDAQWAAAQVDINVRLNAGTITEAQAIAELTAATEDWPTRTLSNADLARRVSQVVANLDGLIVGSGLPDPAVGRLDSHYFDDTTGDFYGPKAIDGWGGVAFSLVGPQGASAKALVISAGELPADATDQDFAAWLRNAQIAAVQATVQPMVDAVAADRQAVDASAGQVEADRQAVDAAAVQVEGDRQAVDAAAAQVEAGRQAVATDRATVVADRQAVDTAAGQVEADRQAVDTAAGQVEADRQAVDLAAGQVEAGRQAVATDRATVVAAAGEVEADRQAVDAGAVAVGADRQAVDAAAVQVEAMRGATQQFRNEAKQFRDEAAAIAGGDFLTEADGNALYRKLADLLSIADVDGLAAALASKATPADIQAAIAALVDGAPTALDTLKELAEALAGNDDAVAALTLALDAKAAKSDLAPDWHVKTGAYAAARLDRVLADTSGGAWSLTLPADGEVQVQDYAGTWASLNLTIIGPVRGVVGDLICDQSAILRFARPPGAAAWIVTKSEGVKA